MGIHTPPRHASGTPGRGVGTVSRLDNMDVLLVPVPAGLLDALGVPGRAEVECVAIVAVLERARAILARERGEVS